MRTLPAMKTHKAVLFGSCCAFTVSAMVHATVINVPGDQPTIQTGIDAAANGDTVLVAPGTYSEVINLGGKAITLQSTGGMDVTIIDGAAFNTSTVTIPDIGAAGQTVVQGFTVSGGKGTLVGVAPSQSRRGGGMHITGGNTVVMECRIQNNTAIMGSGAGSGGGIYGPAGSTGTLALVDCEVLNNNSSGGGCGGGGEGGGLITGGSNLVLLRCTFRGNASSGSGCTGTAGASGGGAHLHAVNSLIMNCTFELNRASGGGYGFGGGLMTTGTTSLANCLLKANDTSCTLNCPGTQSSGIYNWGSSSLLTLRNCTIVSNTLAGLPPGAAGGVYNSSNAPPVQIHNCIVYGNEAQQLTSTTVAQYSLIQGGYAGIGNISGDPLFVNAAGGDYGLQDGSPCRDTGNRSLLPSDAQDLDGDGNTTESLSRDLDMLRRIVNDQVDMGAYEWQRTCLTDISPSAPGMAGDGNTNIGDLLAVIAGWGPCDQCNADVNNDDVVNIADLLAVIAGWGPCP